MRSILLSIYSTVLTFQTLVISSLVNILLLPPQCVKISSQLVELCSSQIDTQRN